MNKYIDFVIPTIIITMFFIVACNRNDNINKDIIIDNDSINITTPIVDTDFCYIIDSLKLDLIKTKEDLFIAKYKLERIAYYNDIAKNGNNITFLRGWINRVLNDEEDY